MSKNEEWIETQSKAKLGKEAWNKGKPNTWSNGEKSNFYIDGRAPMTRGNRRTFMNTLEYVTWRRNVFERDDLNVKFVELEENI